MERRGGEEGMERRGWGRGNDGEKGVGKRGCIITGCAKHAYFVSSAACFVKDISSLCWRSAILY